MGSATDDPNAVKIWKEIRSVAASLEGATCYQSRHLFHSFFTPPSFLPSVSSFHLSMVF